MTILENIPASKLLIPINLESLQELSPELIKITESLDLLLLGYWQVPEQSSPEQVQKQHGEEARDRLDGLAREFDTQDSFWDQQVVFSAKVGKTIDEVARSEDCDAILTPRPLKAIDHILVVLRDDIAYERLQKFLADLITDYKASLTLIFFADADDHSEKELLLEGLKKRLDEESFKEATIDYETVDTKNLTKNILKRSEDCDLLVIGQTSPKLLAKFVATTDEKVAGGANKPVIVVRHDDEE